MNIPTTVHYYRIDKSTPEGAEEYRALTSDRLSAGVSLMRVYGDASKAPNPQDLDVEIERDHLFSDQWNTTCGKRIFAWYESIAPNDDIRIGHWTEITSDLREALRNTNRCGYCGHQEPAPKGNVFCPKCLGDKHLKESELHLLRMLPVEKGMPRRPALSDAERAHLLPLYEVAQEEGNGARGAKERAKARARAEQDLKHAQIEYEGRIWFLDRDMLPGFIYYKHREIFSFGWQTPCDKETVSELLDVISEFPFRYEIKCADGRILEGY